MDQVGRNLVFLGLGVVVLGLIVWGVGALFPGIKFGRLPGDIVVEGERGAFYFPVVTMLLVSAVGTLLLWLIGMVRK